MSAAFRLERAIRSKLSIGDMFALISDPVGVGTLARCKSDAMGTAYQLVNFVQQTPNPDSRVKLSAKKDPFDRPHPQLDWKLSRLDQEGVVKAQHLIAQEVGRSGFGRMRIEMEEGADDFLKNCTGGLASCGHDPHGRRSSARCNGRKRESAPHSQSIRGR